MYLHSKVRRGQSSVACLLLLWAIVAAATGQVTAQTYNVILYQPTAGFSATDAKDLAGSQRVGQGRIQNSVYPDNGHALLWLGDSTTPIDLHPSGFTYSGANATDGARQGGYVEGFNGPYVNHYAALWNGTPESLTLLSNVFSEVTAMAGDQQVGWIAYSDFPGGGAPIKEAPAGTYYLARLWRGTAESVVSLHPAGAWSYSRALDTDGVQQVGHGTNEAQPLELRFRALLWRGTRESVVDLTPPGATYCYAEGVKNGTQVGHCQNGYGTPVRAIVWHNTAQSFRVLREEAVALGTNGTTHVGSASVGYYSHAYRWDGDTGASFDLHTLLPAGVYISSQAKSIDEAGNIIGIAQRADTHELTGVLWRVQGGGGNTPAIQFSAPLFNVSESGPTATLTVTRTGDASLAASVDYATMDGNARQIRDYTMTSGTLRFAPGETSQTLSVILTDDAYTERPHNFNVILSQPVGAVLGTQTAASVMIADNDEGASGNRNPSEEAEFFVRQHYADFLSRVPDAAGLAYWTNRLTECNGEINCVHARRLDVSAAFFVEQEFQDTGYFIHRLYRASYGRPPVYLQFMPDRARLSGGNTEQNKAALVEQWVLRAEFRQEYPATMSNGQFVNHLFEQAGLSAQSAERQAQIEAMNNLGRTRAQVLRAVVEMESFRQREYNPAFVLAQYFGYLRRDAEPEGYNFWLNALNLDAGNARGMVCAFVTSREYQERFGSAVIRSNGDCR